MRAIAYPSISEVSMSLDSNPLMGCTEFVLISILDFDYLISQTRQSSGYEKAREHILQFA
jgi:hypothetical protein